MTLREKYFAEYRAWTSMRYRCRTKTCAVYKFYGARGISFCSEWDSFESFISDMGQRPSKKHSLERIDNDGNYCAKNCRWATAKEQSRNTRRKSEYTFNGETLRLCDWAIKLGLSRGSLSNRINLLGWTIEKALSTPCDKSKYKRGNTVAFLAKSAGIHRNNVYARMKNGVSAKSAISAILKRKKSSK